MSDKFQWWGYLHINGSIQVKRYFDAESLVDANESPFVRKVFGPFDAESRNDALDKLRYEVKALNNEQSSDSSKDQQGSTAS